MKRYLQIVGPAAATMVVLSLPLISLAATGSTGGFDGATGQTTVFSGATGQTGVYTLQNPLAVTSFCQLLKVVLNGVLVIGLPVAVVFLVIVGFKFILARGNPEALRLAKTNLWHTILGIALFLGAWTIAEVIRATVQSLGVSNFTSC